MHIDPNMVSAVKVQFLKPIFEDSFVERGMKAWLIKIEKCDDMYNLYFDFTEFEKENDKYLTSCFFMPGSFNEKLGTAKEAGCYFNKDSYYFSTSEDNNTNDELFAKEISEYIIEI